MGLINFIIILFIFLKQELMINLREPQNYFLGERLESNLGLPGEKRKRFFLAV